VYNSELNLTNPDAECQTEPLEDFEGACSTTSVGNVAHKPPELSHKGQVEALQEEVLHLRARIALLQSEISTKDAAVVEEQTKVAFDCESEVNECGQRLNDLNGNINNPDDKRMVTHLDAFSLHFLDKSAKTHSSGTENG